VVSFPHCWPLDWINLRPQKELPQLIQFQKNREHYTCVTHVLACGSHRSWGFLDAVKCFWMSWNAFRTIQLLIFWSQWITSFATSACRVPYHLQNAKSGSSQSAFPDWRVVSWTHTVNMSLLDMFETTHELYTSSDVFHVSATQCIHSLISPRASRCLKDLESIRHLISGLDRSRQHPDEHTRSACLY
jgi:hypothetical protein